MRKIIYVHVNAGENIGHILPNIIIWGLIADICEIAAICDILCAIPLNCTYKTWSKIPASAKSAGYYKGYMRKILSGTDVKAITRFNIKETNDIYKYYESILMSRNEFDYEMDGLVIKLNSIKSQIELGFTSKFPRWAAALKFPSSIAETTIKDFTFQIGRTGIVTPVAELKEVNISGVNVKRATLHNFDQINKLNVNINDVVLIERAGDVIP